MPPVRQKYRPTSSIASVRVAGIDQSRRAAGRRDHRKRTDDVRREHDLAVGVPRASARAPRIGQALHRAARDIERFEFAVGEKPKASTVGRPEWEPSSVRTLELADHSTGQCAQPQRVGAIGVRGTERQLGAVRRHREGEGHERGVGGRQHR